MTKKRRPASEDGEGASPKNPKTASELGKLLRDDPDLRESGIRAREDFTEVKVIPTGIDTLDGVIANGRKNKAGVPRGRFIVFSGKEGSGKTTAALATSASFQRRGGIVLYIDAERKLDFDWAARNGVNVDDLIMSYPKTIEASFEVSEKAALKTDPSIPLLIVYDSLNAGVTKEERESAYGAKLYAPQQRVLSQALGRMCDHIESSGTTFLMISQLRAKMDASVTIAGGNAVRFYSVLIVTFDNVTKIPAGGKSMAQLRKESPDKRIDVPIVATECTIRPIKNQIGGPFAESKMRVDFNTGIDRVWATHFRAQQLNVIEQAGSWFSFGGRKWQGVDGFRKLIERRPKLLAKIRKAIRRG